MNKISKVGYIFFQFHPNPELNLKIDLIPHAEIFCINILINGDLESYKLTNVRAVGKRQVIITQQWVTKFQIQLNELYLLTIEIITS